MNIEKQNTINVIKSDNKIKMYCIYDRIANIYGESFYFRTENEAIRHFQYVTKQGRYIPSDYDLYYVGKFDNVTANFEMLKKPEFIVRGVERESI